MKKISYSVFMLAAMAFGVSCNCEQKNGETDAQEVSATIDRGEETFTLDTDTSAVIKLPAPNTEGGMPLMEALSDRRTARDFSGESISDQVISDLLWAATGQNREDGRLTAPTARNAQEIETYVYTKAAIFKYITTDHSLQLVKTGDFRAKAGKQPFYENVAIALTFVCNMDKMNEFNEFDRKFYGATDCAFVSQNVYLFCAQEDLKTVVTGMIDREAITELLGIKNGFVEMSQAIGK